MRRILTATVTAAVLATGLVLVSSTTPAAAVTSKDLVGNFAGDDRDEMFWYAAGDVPDVLLSLTRGSGTTVNVAEFRHPVGGNYNPVAGNFDGDAYDEIFWYAPGTAADSLWNFTSMSARTATPFSVSGTFTPVVGDFTGDGTDDIIWYAPGTARDFIWDFDSTGGYTSTEFVISGTYTPIAGSFGTNDTDDVLWYAPGATADHLWDFNVGSTTYSSRPYPISGTYRPIVLDAWNQGWRGDDIFWYAPGTTADSLWNFANGSRTITPQTVSGVYYSTIAGDFLGDSHDDIAWFGEAGESIWDFYPDSANPGQILRRTYTTWVAA